MPIRYQVCEISNGNLKHYYKNPGKEIFWMSYHRASMLTLEEARQVIRKYMQLEPGRNLFIASEWDYYFRETDRYGVILTSEMEEVV